MYTPFEFVPEDIIVIPSPFFDQWLTINRNKQVTINKSKIYNTVVEYNNGGIMTIFKTYSCYGYNSNSYVKIITRYDDRQFEYANGKPKIYTSGIV